MEIPQTIATAETVDSTTTVVQPAKPITTLLVTALIGHKFKLLDATSLPVEIRNRTYYTVSADIDISTIPNIGVIKILNNKYGFVSYTSKVPVASLVEAIFRTIDRNTITERLQFVRYITKTQIPGKITEMMSFLRTNIISMNILTNSGSVWALYDKYIQNMYVIRHVQNNELVVSGALFSYPKITELVNDYYEIVSNIGLNNVCLTSGVSVLTLDAVQEGLLYIIFGAPVKFPGALVPVTQPNSNLHRYHNYIVPTNTSPDSVEVPTLSLVDEVQLLRKVSSFTLVKDDYVIAAELNGTWVTPYRPLGKSHTVVLSYILYHVTLAYLKKHNFEQEKIDAFIYYMKILMEKAMVEVSLETVAGRTLAAITRDNERLQRNFVEIDSVYRSLYNHDMSLLSLEKEREKIVETLIRIKTMPLVFNVNIFVGTKGTTPYTMLMFDTRPFMVPDLGRLIPGLRVGIPIDTIVNSNTFTTIDKHLFVTKSPTLPNALLYIIARRVFGYTGTHPHMRVESSATQRFVHEDDIYNIYYTPKERKLVDAISARYGGSFKHTNRICKGTGAEDFFHAVSTRNLEQIISQFLLYLVTINDRETWGKSIYSNFLLLPEDEEVRNFFDPNCMWTEEEFNSLYVNLKGEPMYELTEETIKDVFVGSDSTKVVYAPYQQNTLIKLNERYRIR